MIVQTFPKPAPRKARRRKPIPFRSVKGQEYVDECAAITPAVMARAGYLCEVQTDGCTQEPEETPHHRKRRGQGGPNTMDNLLAVCRPCHNRIHRGVWPDGAGPYDLGLLIHRDDLITPYLVAS